MIICYCDGGAKPNPGKCYGSFKIIGIGNGIVTERLNFVDGTNNQAEYWALISLLDYLVENHVKRALIRMDSMLVIKQILGEFRVNNDKLFPLWEEAIELVDKIPNLKFEHINDRRMKTVIGH